DLRRRGDAPVVTDRYLMDLRGFASFGDLQFHLHEVVEADGLAEVAGDRKAGCNAEGAVSETERGVQGGLHGLRQTQRSGPVVDAGGVGVSPLDAPPKGDRS